jgi:hypothetical protein
MAVVGIGRIIRCCTADMAVFHCDLPMLNNVCAFFRVRVCHKPKLPLLPELENLFGFILQIYRAYGARGNKHLHRTLIASSLPLDRSQDEVWVSFSLIYSVCQNTLP